MSENTRPTFQRRGFWSSFDYFFIHLFVHSFIHSFTKCSLNARHPLGRQVMTVREMITGLAPGPVDLRPSGANGQEPGSHPTADFGPAEWDLGRRSL